jgi:hypothetical protein
MAKQRYRMRNPYYDAEQFNGPCVIRCTDDRPADVPECIVYIAHPTEAGMLVATMPHAMNPELAVTIPKGTWIVIAANGSRFLYANEEFQDTFRPAMEPVS